MLTEFVQSRKGDRLGLVLFGDAAFVQTPFTADQKVWLELLNQTDVAMAGQSTHLGDAIGLAIKVFEQSDKSRGALEQDQNREKVAIVLTDGNDTGSFVEPIDAAKVAKAKGVRVHVIAMGDPETIGETALDMDTIHALRKNPAVKRLKHSTVMNCRLPTTRLANWNLNFTKAPHTAQNKVFTIT